MNESRGSQTHLNTRLLLSPEVNVEQGKQRSGLDGELLLLRFRGRIDPERFSDAFDYNSRTERANYQHSKKRTPERRRREGRSDEATEEGEKRWDSLATSTPSASSDLMELSFTESLRKPRMLNTSCFFLRSEDMV